MIKLNEILLIDDDYATNLLHSIHIEQLNITSKIKVVENGVEAIEYLKKCTSLPNLIFLDINMPIMDGWTFLENYKKLWQPKDSFIVMLSSSINPEDHKKASKDLFIKHFASKPLNYKNLTIVIELFMSNIKKVDLE